MPRVPNQICIRFSHDDLLIFDELLAQTSMDSRASLIRRLVRMAAAAAKKNPAILIRKQS